MHVKYSSQQHISRVSSFGRFSPPISTTYTLILIHVFHIYVLIPFYSCLMRSHDPNATHTSTSAAVLHSAHSLLFKPGAAALKGLEGCFILCRGKPCAVAQHTSHYTSAAANMYVPGLAKVQNLPLSCLSLELCNDRQINT